MKINALLDPISCSNSQALVYVNFTFLCILLFVVIIPSQLPAGTDDDLPPSHQNRSTRGGLVSRNGRPVVGSHAYPRVQIDMESQIHQIEQEAYTSVLRAFKAQSDAITWVFSMHIYAYKSFIWFLLLLSSLQSFEFHLFFSRKRKASLLNYGKN